MTEPQEQGKPEFDVDKYVASLSEVSPGHADGKGKVRPEFVDMEIRNKVAGIGTYMYLWEMKKADKETIEKLARQSLKRLGSLYPERKTFIADIIQQRNIKSLIPYIGIFEEPEEK